MRNGDIQTALRSTPMSRRGFREDGRFVIGALGSLSYRKGQDVLIEALAALRAAGVDAVVRLGGGGDPAPLCAKARALGVADHVVFLGWVDAVSFLSEIDVFCLPSRAEPFGIVLIEAMSQGAPVVASDVDGPADILEGGAGLLTPPGDVAALMEALRRVADDPDQAAVLADAGRRRAAERYAPKAIGETLIEAFRNFGARL
ncbi:MAG: glycosyltransferase family 4 protein [Pseudomonadota bacterium]